MKGGQPKQEKHKDRYFLSANCAYHYCEMCCVGYVIVCVVYIVFCLYEVHDEAFETNVVF